LSPHVLVIRRQQDFGSRWSFSIVDFLLVCAQIACGAFALPTWIGRLVSCIDWRTSAYVKDGEACSSFAALDVLC